MTNKTAKEALMEMYAELNDSNRWCENVKVIKEELDSKIPFNVKMVIWEAWNELNTIRARDGVPRDYNGYRTSVCENYFSKVVDDLANILGEDCKPWPPKKK